MEHFVAARRIQVFLAHWLQLQPAPSALQQLDRSTAALTRGADDDETPCIEKPSHPRGACLLCDGSLSADSYADAIAQVGAAAHHEQLQFCEVARRRASNSFDIPFTTSEK